MKSILMRIAPIMLLGSAGAGAVEFQNVTTSLLNEYEVTPYRFDVMWSDFNGDGCYDPFMIEHTNAASSLLWINSCDGRNRFTMVRNSQANFFQSSPSWILGSGWATVLDFNGDGKEDYWMRHANSPAARHINGSASEGSIPTFSGKELGCDDNCRFGDINGDNILDIVHSDLSVEHMLTRNEISPAKTNHGRRMMIVDVTNDGWPEVMQPEEGGYWLNNMGDLSWRNGSMVGGMNLMSAADYNNDGWIDFVTYSGNAESDGGFHVYRNNSGTFSEVQELNLGFASYYTNYGNVVSADFNNDGLIDIFVAGGIRPDFSDYTLLINQGNFQFADSGLSFGDAAGDSQNAKPRADVADYDGDGKLDIVVTQRNTAIAIYRNSTNSDNNWMGVRVRGAGKNTDGVHTTVRWFEAGTSRLLSNQQVQVNSQHSLKHLHAGLGDVSRVDLEVTYPHSGETYKFENIPVNQRVIVYANGCLIQNYNGGPYPLQTDSQCQYVAGQFLFRSGFEV